MIIYVAGPMTGYPEHNFPAFHAATALLREQGHTVINPAELDEAEPNHEELAKVPWDYYLRRDIKLLADCTAIYMLPGWEQSRGATLEHHIATTLGMEVLHAPAQ